MSSWTDEGKWERYLSKEGCPICNQTPQSRPSTERDIADLAVSRLIADRNAALRQTCCLVLRPHVIEMHQLSDDEGAAFMRDMKMTSLALQNVTGAVKLNYEIHGNTIPHMHMHLWPRQIGDKFENAPIDWRMKDAGVYSEGEFETFIETMKAEIRKVEQRAAGGAA